MAQPKKYQRTKDFAVNTGSATDHPAINTEFDSVALTTDQIRANLAKIQSDDGSLRLVAADAKQFADLSAPRGAVIVGFTPVGNISANNVQAAIAEVDAEKASLASLAAPGGAGLVATISGDTVQAELLAIAEAVAVLHAAQSAGVIGKDTLSSLNADLAHSDGTVAYVLNDPAPANNTTYRKNGATGAGGWVVSSASPVESLRADLDSMMESSNDLSGALLTVKDALGRVGLQLLTDGTLIARLPEKQTFGAGVLDYGADTLDDLFTIIDASGKVALSIRRSGQIVGNIVVPDSPTVIANTAAINAAKGARASLGDRISQHLNPYGMPKLHQWGEWYLRETRQRLRKCLLSESAQLVVASIGDSWTHNRDRWCGPTAKALIGTYGDAGSGWTGFGNLNGTFLNGNVDSTKVGVAFSGAWDYSVYYSSPSPDLGQATSSTAGDKITITGQAGTSAVPLHYIGGVGVIQYRWNAGAWTQLDLAGAGRLTAPLAGVPAGAWTLELENVSGTATLCGVDIQKSTDGVRWHRLAATGSAASQWAGVNAAQWQAGLAALAPNLVTILLATNDQAAYDVATFKAHVQTIVTMVRAALPLADILLIIPCENGRANARPMTDYAQAMYELAVTNKCCFMDLQYLFGETFAEYASTSARAWFNADNIHPEPLTGGRVIVDAVTRLLTN